MKNLNISEQVGKFVNRYSYSDTNPVGEIIGTKGKSIILVQIIEAIKQKEKLNYIIGGFLAHCTNQDEQKWEFVKTSEIVEMKVSKAFFKQYGIDEKPKKFYDYNF
jgi:hypothetical protein